MMRRGKRHLDNSTVHLSQYHPRQIYSRGQVKYCTETELVKQNKIWQMGEIYHNSQI